MNKRRIIAKTTLPIPDGAIGVADKNHLFYFYYSREAIEITVSISIPVSISFVSEYRETAYISLISNRYMPTRGPFF